MTRNAFGDAVRRIRIHNKESQAQAAASFGISQPSWQRWEAGATVPSPRRYGALASYLGTTEDVVWRLIHGEEEEPSDLETLMIQLGDLHRTVEELQHLPEKVSAFHVKSGKIEARVMELERQIKDLRRQFALRPPSRKRELDDDELLTLQEVAGYLKISESTARKWADEGRIPGALPKIGGVWRFNKAILLAYLRGRRPGASASRR